MKRYSFAVGCILIAASLSLTRVSAQSPQRVIIDTDPGVDDAMAILLALNSPELKVEALTVVPGNVDGRGIDKGFKTGEFKLC